MALMTKRNKILRLIPATICHGFDMMHFHVPIIDRDRHAVFVNEDVILDRIGSEHFSRLVQSREGASFFDGVANNVQS